MYLYDLNLQLGVEAVTQAFLWIAFRGKSQTKHAVILTDSMSFLQNVEREAQTSVCQCSTSTLENSSWRWSEGKWPSR